LRAKLSVTQPVSSSTDIPYSVADGHCRNEDFLRLGQARFCKVLDRLHYPAQPVSTVWREVLGNADFAEKVGVGFSDIVRLRLAVKIAE
jgi:hypothetical protein